MMNRFGVPVAALLILTIAGILLASQDDTWVVDPDAPWVVEHSGRFLPPDWGNPVAIQAVSPKGSWLYGLDEMHPEQPQCVWNTSSWERTCVELDPDEAISFIADFAWSPDDTAFVVPTYSVHDENHHVIRLLRIDLASGELTTLLQSEPGTYLRQVTFSPDGSQIAFLEVVDDTAITIRRIDRDGNGLETILPASDAVTLMDATDLRWTAANQLIFFSGPHASETQGYFRVNSDGSGLERIAAVTPGESETRILDISADGRFMIAEGLNGTDACGADFIKASSYVVDLERDEIAQVICAVYQPTTPGGRGVRLFGNSHATVMQEPSFMPDGSIVTVVELRMNDRYAAGLAVIDAVSGQISVVTNDLSGDSMLWAVSTGLDDGSARIWVGGYWRDQATLRPAP